MHHAYFDLAIMFCIAANAFIMVLQHDGQPDSLTSSSAQLADLFTFVYFVEFLLKVGRCRLTLTDPR